MAISRLLVSVLLVNLYLYCYTSGESVKESELVAAEKELEELAVQDVYHKMAKDELEKLAMEDAYHKMAKDELLELSMNQIMNDILSKKTSEDPAKCHDAGGDRCKLLVKMNYCHTSQNKAQMREICFKSCGYCRMPSPPKCSATENGCCWDKTTAKIDKMGTNCRACKDDYTYLCETFKDDCYSSMSSGTFMKKHCPKLCKICGDHPVCFDDPKQSDYCPTWAKEGGCKTMRETMKIYCRKSCGLC